MAENTALTITLKAPGRRDEQPPLPRALQPRVRAAGPVAEDAFLPPGYVRAVAAVDLSAAARSAADGAREKELPAQPGQVIALDLANGVTIFTSPANLKATIERIAPDAIDADGAVHLDALGERGVATRSIGEGVSQLLARVTTLDVGAVSDAIIEAARKKALEWLRERGEEKIAEYAELGVSWLGTKALMWAIENRLQRAPGLYRWVRATGEPGDLEPVDGARLAADAKQGALLVFIHGTGSNTAGSYGDLQATSREYWRQFAARFDDRIYAFEHRTMSESPVENALQLARALPAKARLNIVTHSRGGIVGDLLCLDRLDGADRALIDGYAVDGVALGEVEGEERERLAAELERAYGEQRAHLRELAAVLRERQFVIERYVRVACPARGTRLASGNFDVFMSSLLWLVGLVPGLAGSPLYSAFKRVVLEIAKNRTRPNLVPGIEAMLPESPMARLLARASPQAATQMAVIAGDVEGGGLLKRLGVVFTDHALFDGMDNDFVVDSDSMYAGVARPQKARALFDRGPEVSHFRYFTNDLTRNALRRWLLEANVDGVELFKPLPGIAPEPSGEERKKREAQRRATRGMAAALPIVVVLPGIMGSHLWVRRKDRVWFEFKDLLTGGLKKIRYAVQDIEAEALFDNFYGEVCEHLAQRHQVEPFPYDWRQPLDVIAADLAKRLRKLLDESAQPQRPVRLLAHSMGGLVVRALVHGHRKLWDELMRRDGARFVMLGTPNQGSHLMVETLLGKSRTTRMLGRLDLEHDLQGVIDIVAEFPGALQLLPRPGFTDTAAGEAKPADGERQKGDYYDAKLWADLKREMRDFWFGDGVAATPLSDALKAGRWLWDRDGVAPSLPDEHKSKVHYVCGSAPSTPCGLVKEGRRWKMLGTPRGDGSVTWASGRIRGIPEDHYYYMPAEHGALADSAKYFASIELLLSRGERGELMDQPAVTRGDPAAAVVAYEAGPPAYPTELDIASGLIGRRPRVRGRAQPLPVLKVRVRAMDLRELTKPVLVGHYEQDAIAGPESLIDRELVNNALSMRYNLGLYAGPIGTATVVLLPRNEMERSRGSYRGAVVAGLGRYDGSLGVGTLTDAVRAAALRYLLHTLDATQGLERGEVDAGLPLASMLLGYNSSANLTISDAVTALVRGVAEANRRFADSTRSNLRIDELEIIELYIDTAISATYALRDVASTLNNEPSLRCRIEADLELRQGDGMCARLEVQGGAAYWPRLSVTDADRHEDECPPECYTTRCPPECYGDEGEGPVGKDGDAGDDPLMPIPDRRLPPWLRRRLALAERLRFLYLGQRARAETIVQQRQPGLVEKLVAQQLHVRTYQEDFSRMLFQLLVPHDFKDAARQLDRLVMVVDGYTANLPWELMLADDRPLAVKAALVRQLSSTRFRMRVRQTSERRAYVIGNPSTEGFARAFPNPRLPDQTDPPSLAAAENEATVVTEVLTQCGYDVVPAIGADQRAVDVINRLYQHAYRILHVAAHGVYDVRHADGSTRSGVVLSDGLLITAAEIGAMEVVPDLVFMNCCHLGKVDRAPTAFNRLAYSVARELIEIGVRAVVVAGWAVDDDAASLFADTFYRAMLVERKMFGDAVFDARNATYQRFPASITWGAYQAYGEPSWRLEARVPDRETPSASRRPVAPEEVAQWLDQERLGIKRSEHRLEKSDAERIVRRVEKFLADVPKNFLTRAIVSIQLGRLYGELGREYYGRAMECLRAAMQAEDRRGRTPIVAIELLAKLEARAGEADDLLEPIDRAIERLRELDQAASATAGDEQTNAERAALIGSAHKRKAAVYARRYLRAKPGAKGTAALAAEMKRALEESKRAYLARFDRSKIAEAQPYLAQNWLQLAAVTGEDAAKGEKRGNLIAMAQACGATARARFGDDPGYWNAIMVAEAALAVSLLDGSLHGDAQADRLRELERSFEEAMTGILRRPSEVDSTVQQLCLLALYYTVYGRLGDADAGKTAGALRMLAEKLAPGACEDVPPPQKARAAKSTARPRPKRGRKPRAG